MHAFSFFDGNNALTTYAFHCFSNLLANRSVGVFRDGCYLFDLFFSLNCLGILFDFLNDSFNGFFDATPQFIEAMKNNQMQGVVVQNPFAIGELGVKTMVDSLLGKAVEKRIDTGVMIVTPENMNSPEAQKLLNPPIG